MSLKLFLDADLTLLRLDAECLEGMTMPQPQLGVALTESMQGLAEALHTLLEKHFVVGAQYESGLPISDLGEFQAILSNQIWRFRCWAFSGSIRKGYMLEGIPLIGVRTDMRSALDYDFTEVQRLRQLSELSSIVLLQVDARWHLTYANKTLVDAYGKALDNTDAVQGWQEIFHEEDRADFLATLFEHSKQDKPFQIDVRLKSIWGQVFHVLAHCQAVFSNNGLLESVIIMMVEMESRPKLYQLGKVQSANDEQLSDVYNRHGLMDILESSLRILNPQQCLTIFHIDLDNFKLINNAYSRSTGDQILVALSERLQESLRSGDILARLGGDEFVILIQDITTAQACESIAHKILNAVTNPYQLASLENRPYLSASVGVRLFSASELQDKPITSVANAQKLAVRLLGEAESAMHQAKSLGGNMHILYAHDDRAGDGQDLSLSAALHRAVNKREFELYYQPQINVKTQEIYGCECLIRWPGARWKTERFVRALEDTHLMRRMGRWVLSHSIQQFAELIMGNDCQPILSVNISHIQFQDDDFVEFVQSCLQKNGVSPQQLTLEIKESLLADFTVNLESRLHALKKLGVNIALDDFGTGYTSLTHLNRFPIDIIKIDHNLIQDIQHTSSYKTILAILGLGETLDRLVIAEGVETQQQWQLLQDSHCYIAQGWLFAPVLSYEGMQHFCRHRTENVNQFMRQVKSIV